MTATLHLWLSGCSKEQLTEAFLSTAVRKGAKAAAMHIQSFHCSQNDGHVVALAVLSAQALEPGDTSPISSAAHLVLHGEPKDGSLCAEALSFAQAEQARTAIEHIRVRFTHEQASEHMTEFDGSCAQDGEEEQDIDLDFDSSALDW